MHSLEHGCYKSSVNVIKSCLFHRLPSPSSTHYTPLTPQLFTHHYLLLNLCFNVPGMRHFPLPSPLYSEGSLKSTNRILGLLALCPSIVLTALWMEASLADSAHRALFLPFFSMNILLSIKPCFQSPQCSFPSRALQLLTFGTVFSSFTWLIPAYS